MTVLVLWLGRVSSPPALPSVTSGGGVLARVVHVATRVTPATPSLEKLLEPPSTLLRPLRWAPGKEDEFDAFAFDARMSHRRLIFEALSNCRASLSERMRWQIADAIEVQSRRHGYDPLFVQALIEVESTCSPTARSPRGAIGLTQLRPSTAQAVAREAGIKYQGPQTLLDPARNVEIGLLYLSQLEEQLGDLHLAMAAYNLGPGRVARMPKRSARSARYVRKVLARYELLRESASA